jgi:predicted RNase H-like HicB family nuclease
MTKTYEEAMEELNVAAYAALRAALNEDGAPVDALREIAQRSTA